MPKSAILAAMVIVIAGLYAANGAETPHAAQPHVSAPPPAPHFNAAPHINVAPHLSTPPHVNVGPDLNATPHISGAPRFNPQSQVDVERPINPHVTISAPSPLGIVRGNGASSLHDVRARALLTARAAIAGSNHGRNGWWRHRNGGYGWVGPLFWPFAYDDVYDYALWGEYDDAFWDYGYDDIYAGLFSPYGQGALAGYLPGANETEQAGAAAVSLAQMCGSDRRGIDTLPLDQVKQALQPNDAQRAALEEFARASAEATQLIAAACPTEIPSTAPKRLAMMQQRIEAMIAAVKILRVPLDKLYAGLTDEQKARLTGLGRDRRQNAIGSLAQGCAAAALTWPSDQIERMVRPTDAQQQGLAAFTQAAAKAADILKASCPNQQPLTAPARLAAVESRLETMLQAVQIVRAALDPFYAALSDDQKAAFDAIGLQQTSALQQPSARQSKHHRRHVRARAFRRIGSVIRHLFFSIGP